jgi:adenine-specific DNA-methyltransferase
MRRRLVIARRLLKPDGVLIVTIDEHEVHHLGMLLEEVMRGYLQHTVTIVINPKGTGKLNFARVDEYAIYCVPDLGFSVIAGEPTAAGEIAEASEGEIEDEEEDGAATDDANGGASGSAEQSVPFPPDEADL